jgi:hypothetical protein
MVGIAHLLHILQTDKSKKVLRRVGIRQSRRDSAQKQQAKRKDGAGRAGHEGILEEDSLNKGGG